MDSNTNTTTRLDSSAETLNDLSSGHLSTQPTQAPQVEPAHGQQHLEQQRQLVQLKEQELKEMQEQLESYNQMVKQLGSQREMAVKKLADMDSHIEELKRRLDSERLLVEAKDRELKTQRTQIEALKSEEDELNGTFNRYREQFEQTSKDLETTRLRETQIQQKLQEFKQFLTATGTSCEEIDKAISIKDTIKLSALCSQLLTLPTLTTTNNNNHLQQQTNGLTTTTTGDSFSTVNDSAAPPATTTNFNSDFITDSLFKGTSTGNFDPFANQDPFQGDDPFESVEPDLVLPPDDPFNPRSYAGGAAGATASPFASQPDGRLPLDRFPLEHGPGWYAN